MQHALQMLRSVPQHTIFLVVEKKGLFFKHGGEIHRVVLTKYLNGKVRITTRPFRGSIKPRRKKCVVVDLRLLLPSQAEVTVHPGGKKRRSFHDRVVAMIHSATGDVDVGTSLSVAVKAGEEDD